MIGATLFTAACAGQLREGVRVAGGGVYFQLRRPAATSVAVAGDFNGWSREAHPMTRSGAFWTSVVALPPGDYVFMYVVDGVECVTPPNATALVPDGFGALNGKITVP
jgi:1,4-alpha-glucan branching enzyme